MSQDNNIIVLNQEADEEEISVNIAELIHVLCSKIHINSAFSNFNGTGSIFGYKIIYDTGIYIRNKVICNDKKWGEFVQCNLYRTSIRIYVDKGLYGAGKEQTCA